ncbi:MAG: YbhB/YbcL family Raf kinase inhibitor-like protein [bacterium]|nr:YbhB/YbcL family Raf kinase inhibitor-like protein [Myxococcales bacterium]MCB9541151.1 YbhB/YbcL family Raf kinase inhibitor-like protein [Myxococcales bacterium]
MKFWSDSFGDGARIPARFALGRPHPEDHVELSENVSPHFGWADLPEGTRSLVLVCHDPDCPSSGEDVNQEGRTVPRDLPRVDFYHWLLLDLDPGRGRVEEGAFGKGVTPHGKDGPDGPEGTRSGRNDYTGWFAGDEDMAGDWYGYDGPCPPWNDEREHRYVFTLYALDVPKAPVGDRFDGKALREAIAGHVLGHARWTGTYAIHPDAKPAGPSPADQ